MAFAVFQPGIEFACDQCGHTLQTPDSTTRLAWRYAMKRKWVSLTHDGNEFFHFCSAYCKDIFTMNTP